MLSVWTSPQFCHKVKCYMEFLVAAFESAEHDQTAHTCRPIMLYTLYKINL